MEAAELEAMAKRNFERDKEMRKMAPPVDWESVANEGAERIKAAWDATEGELRITRRAATETCW